MSNKYYGVIDVEFDVLPTLVPQTLTTKESNPLERFYEATKRREFQLVKDWSISINNAKYAEDLNGEIIIPQKYNNIETLVDGASVPLPWLVNFASLGILCPLGVILTGSVVHDFAYEHGGLLYKKPDGTTEFREIRRDIADDLFRDIIATVNQLPVTSKIAWLAVRLGYFGVNYNKKTQGGEFPSVALVAAAAILIVLWVILSMFGFTATLVIVAILYGITAILLAVGGKKEEEKPATPKQAT
ncbi:hypothetical protein MNBD_GAMMA16-83 [hydrothermal vent metagenome]|uniref:DUF1353 domain-containing protein n=1 Tax=hydrothermal vent metagenome TaxID=652676 RepID=A0A3B0ZM99_9ZZZZ